ncbi:MAG: phytanoyl-CoA dioxygenase family protein [Chthonomonadales bacterium]|nr:phytanoyl-CoA dioxygenase family protein [Chthonomonadales bacterium]
MTTYPLSEEQVRFYQENGYIQLFDVLPPDELARTRSALDDANRLTLDARHHTSAANPEYERVFVQKVNLWRVHEGMRRYVLNARVAEIARRLAGAERIRLWHDHALVKMPGDSRESPWHQDLPYWPMNESGALSCWMALDDVDERNGCMQFVPRSQSWGQLEPIRLVNAQDLFGLVTEPETKDFTPVVMRMPAGSCTFHHGLTFHYASANSTDRPRRAIITIYMPDGTTYSGKPHVVTDGLGLVPGQAFEGPMFPVLAGETVPA